MDLGAFLSPGVSYSIKMRAGPRVPSNPDEPPDSRPDAASAGPLPDREETDAEEIRGRVEEHRGRPFWLVSRCPPLGRVLSITVEMSGYSLADDGALIPGGPAALAYVVLVGRAGGCRLIRPWKLYALRLELLGRVWP